MIEEYEQQIQEYEQEQACLQRLTDYIYKLNAIGIIAEFARAGYARSENNRGAVVVDLYQHHIHYFTASVLAQGFDEERRIPFLETIGTYDPATQAVVVGLLPIERDGFIHTYATTTLVQLNQPNSRLLDYVEQERPWEAPLRLLLEESSRMNGWITMEVPGETQSTGCVIGCALPALTQDILRAIKRMEMEQSDPYIEVIDTLKELDDYLKGKPIELTLYARLQAAINVLEGRQ